LPRGCVNVVYDRYSLSSCWNISFLIISPRTGEERHWPCSSKYFWLTSLRRTNSAGGGPRYAIISTRWCGLDSLCSESRAPNMCLSSKRSQTCNESVHQERVR
jgi:hypothetical protein